MTAASSHRGSFLVRSVDHVARGDGWVDLSVSAVRYWPLEPMPGLLTTEDPVGQGLELRLPNAPALGAGMPVETRAGVVRLRMPGRATFRMTLWAGEGWDRAADGIEDGIVVSAGEGWPFELSEEPGSVTLATDQASMTIRRQPFGWALAGRDGRRLSASGGDRRQVAGFPLAPALAFGDGMASCSFELAPAEAVVGFGEQFGNLAKGGARLCLVAEDALGAGTGRTYKAAPVFHSSAGYSGFVHTPGPVTADVGARHPAVLSLECEEERMDLFLFAGAALKDRLRAYTAVTGRAPAPPPWALGVWMSRCRYRNRAELAEAASGMRAHGVPCDVLSLDPDWLELDLLNCDFGWSWAKFGDPAELVAQLAAEGFHLCLWELPYLDPESPLHVEAEQSSFLVHGARGGLAEARVFARDGRPRHLVDFSNPRARAWWKRQHLPLLELGVAAFTTDFGEGLVDDAVMDDRRSGRTWRNLYPLWYNRTVSEAITPNGGLVWGRSGWAGSQRYPAQWGGDPESSVAGMAATLRAGLSWSLSAPGLWGHDIGGFYGPGPSAECYIRWAQWGCLSPLARFHGLGPREPWQFGEVALGIVREFARLRYRLLPYLMSVAGEAARFGWPMMRALCVEYPDELSHWSLDTQYLLGSDLLVVPVLDDSPDPVRTRCVIPPGGWVDLWSGVAYQGPSVIHLEVPLERAPVFVRAGSVVPMWPTVVAHSGAYSEGAWTMHCWPAPAGASGVVYDGGLTHRYHLEPGGEALRCEEAARRAATAVAHLPGEPDRQLALVRSEPVD